MKTIVLLFVILTMGLDLAAEATVDSLQIRIDKSEGVAKAEAWYDAVSLYVKKDPDRARQYAADNKAYALSNGDPLIQAYALLNEGIYYSSLDRSDTTIVLIQEAWPLAVAEQDTLCLIRLGQNLGRAYMATGDAEGAIKYLFQSLRLLAEHPEPEADLKVRVIITWAYLELKRYRDAVAFGRRSLGRVTPKHEYVVPYFCNNMAACYGAMGQLDSAKYFVLKGLPIAEANEDYNIVANALFLLGDVYLESDQYDLAIAQYEKAKPYRDKLGNVYFMVADLNVLCDLYCHQGYYEKGIKTGLEGLALANKHHLTLDFEELYSGLARNYEGLHDYKNASHYYYLLAYAKDSVYQKSNAAALKEMEARYEAEGKDRRIKELSSSNTLQAAIIERNYLFIGGLLVTIMLLSVIFWQRRNRLKQQQHAVIQEQKVRFREAQINAVIDSQEAERKRLASDLHDGMGQLVTALQLNIQAIKEKEDLSERVTLVDNSQHLLTDIQQEIRNVAFNLMPAVLLKDGLIAAVQELARRINASQAIAVEVKAHDTSNRLEDLQEIALYRVLQELLSNIVRHASATKVVISFTGHEDEFNVTVEDNGRGFDVDLFKGSQKGNGWNNIQSRLNLIRGSISIDSAVGRQGTTVIIDTPRHLPSAETLTTKYPSVGI